MQYFTFHESPVPSLRSDALAFALNEIFAFMKEHSSSRFSEAAVSSFVPDIGTENTDPSLAGETAVSQPEVSEQADEQMVLQNRATNQVHSFVKLKKEHNRLLYLTMPFSLSFQSITPPKVSFDLQSILEVPQHSNKENDTSLAKEFFGEQPATMESP